MLQLGGMLSKKMQFKYITDGGLGAKPPATGQFFEKITILTSLGSHFERFLRPLERTKLLRLKIYLKFFNSQPFQPSLIADQIQTTLKRSHT